MPSRAQIKNPKTFFMEIGRLRETVKVCVIFYSVFECFLYLPSGRATITDIFSIYIN